MGASLRDGEVTHLPRGVEALRDFSIELLHKQEALNVTCSHCHCCHPPFPNVKLTDAVHCCKRALAQRTPSVSSCDERPCVL